jgi:transcriptional regulator with XRE-family HTH domain
MFDICYMLNQKVGENLKKLRMLNDFSQDHVEMSCNISHSTYSKIENGTGPINMEKLETFAKFYKVDPVTIITMSDKGSFIRQQPEGKTEEPKVDYGKTDVELAKEKGKNNELKKEIVYLKIQVRERDKTISDKEMIIDLLTGEAYRLKSK